VLSDDYVHAVVVTVERTSSKAPHDGADPKLLSNLAADMAEIMVAPKRDSIYSRLNRRLIKRPEIGHQIIE
jgi:hypothetical protein